MTAEDDEKKRHDVKPTLVVICALVLVVTAMFGLPWYSRYQRLQDANNAVVVSQIQNQTQLVEVENKKAEVRVAAAKGIAQSQRIIVSSLSANYLQYLATSRSTKRLGFTRG